MLLNAGYSAEIPCSIQGLAMAKWSNNFFFFLFELLREKENMDLNPGPTNSYQVQKLFHQLKLCPMNGITQVYVCFPSSH
jgi:hypothetical protein